MSILLLLFSSILSNPDSMFLENMKVKCDSIFYAGDYKGAAKCYEDGMISSNKQKFWFLFLKYSFDLSFTYNELSFLDKSEILLDSTIIKGISVVGNQSPHIAHLYESYGMLYLYKGMFEESIENYKKSLKIKLDALGAENVFLSTVYNNIALVYWEMEDFETAITYLDKGTSLGLKFLGEKHPEVASGYNNKSTILKNMGKYDEALDYAFRCLNIWKETYGENNLYMGSIYNNIGNIYVMMKDYINAEVYLKKSHHIFQLIFQDINPKIAMSAYNLGIFYLESGNKNQSYEYFYNALKMYKINYNGKHPNMGEVYRSLADLKLSEKKYEECLEFVWEGIDSNYKLNFQKKFKTSAKELSDFSFAKSTTLGLLVVAAECYYEKY